jgi:2-keto-3-deoxy-L-rhamnonate aldolase RhmA
MRTPRPTYPEGKSVRANEVVHNIVKEKLARNEVVASMTIRLVRDAYVRTIATCCEHGKHGGVSGLSSRSKLAVEFVTMGARLVSNGTDIQSLLAAAIKKAKQVRVISK